MALPDPTLVNATVAPPVVCAGNSTENCVTSSQVEMCAGNSTDGCVPGVIPLSTTVLPIMENGATKEGNVTMSESTTAAVTSKD